ncbi:hypothetical protein [Nocardioides nematodiphilus]|uniref:hypothetical protein n=1 Tax=Nocardioides nematodiphilus TaxID=2849669 RepID=UPI001CD9370E|nr:hypothetical protein [Nocardioides nematodiphilus]MCA1984786.1 hypothetical protein [Nocardioides nematodiphilus]
MEKLVIAVLSALSAIGPALVARLSGRPSREVKRIRELTAAIDEIEPGSHTHAELTKTRLRLAKELDIRVRDATLRTVVGVLVPFCIIMVAGMAWSADTNHNLFGKALGGVAIVYGIVLFPPFLVWLLLLAGLESDAAFEFLLTPRALAQGFTKTYRRWRKRDGGGVRPEAELEDQ